MRISDWSSDVCSSDLSNFILQALRGEPLTVYGDGSQSRSFCYVDDLIDGMVQFMATGPEHPGPLNLGNPEEFTVQQLAETVVRLVGSDSKITALDRKSVV